MVWKVVVSVVIGFVLRLGLPLAIVLAVGCWLRCLNRQWQAEEKASSA